MDSHVGVAILVSLTATASSVINGIITGQAIGHDALIAFGLANPIFIFVGALSGILSNGGTISCSKYMGAGMKTEIASNFTLVTVVTVVLGVVLTVLFVPLSGPIGDFFGGGPEIQRMTADYLFSMALSVIPFLVVQNLLLYIRSDNNQRLVLVSMVSVVVFNALFALWSAKCTDMGIRGIGYSIGVGSIVGIALCLLHFRRKERMLRFGRITNAGSEMRNILFAGLPTAINRASQTLKNLILNSYVLTFGGFAIASLTVQTNVYQFLIAISTGYGIVTAVMCGMFLGEKDRRSIRDTVRAAIVSGVIVSSVAGLLLFVFSDQIAALFINGDGDVAMASRCLKFFAFSQPTSTVCLIILYMYQALGNIVLTTVVSLTRGFGYVVLISLLLSQFIGLDGVWISFVLADLLSILTIMAVIAVKTGRFPRCIDDFILPVNARFDCVTVCDITVRNDPSEIGRLGGRISGYCADAGISGNEASSVARSVCCLAEGISANLTDSKDHYIEIRIVKDGDDLILRTRDDGRPFNPMSIDEPAICELRSSAKGTDYRYNIKMNILSVRFRYQDRRPSSAKPVVDARTRYGRNDGPRHPRPEHGMVRVRIGRFPPPMASPGQEGGPLLYEG